MTHHLIATLRGTLGTEPGSVYGIAVSVLLAALIALRRIPPLFFLAAFPATVLHETSHWLAALVLNGRPAAFSVVPRRSGRGYMLGSVECANIRWYNGWLIALAPLALVPAALALLVWRARVHTALQPLEMLWAYAIACLFEGALPSWRDLHTAFTASWLPALAAGAAIVWWAERYGW
jgi:hypothetical protein